MDWNIFWSAFGAIGTTVGSMITAIAVVIAVKQYRQPITKVIEVTFGSALTVERQPMELYTISIKNRGVRPVVINSINAQGNKKNLFLNNMHVPLEEKYKKFPARIEPEECATFYFVAEDFRGEMQKMVDLKVLKKRMKFKVFVTDSLGDYHFCKNNVRVKKLLK